MSQKTAKVVVSGTDELGVDRQYRVFCYLVPMDLDDVDEAVEQYFAEQTIFRGVTFPAGLNVERIVNVQTVDTVEVIQAPI